MTTKVKEQHIQREILHYLTLRKDVGMFWRNHSTGIFDPSRGIFRRAVGAGIIPGVSDILGVTKGGRFVALEVKRPGGAVTMSQREFLARVNAHGGYAKCVHSLDEAMAFIKELEGDKHGDDRTADYQ